MARVCFALVLMLLTSAQAVAHPPLIIRHDTGGRLGARAAEIRELAESGQAVELRGTCLSACTLYLALPQTCVAQTALLGFHGPSDRGQRLSDPEFEHWSQLMARHYREPLRSWYLTHARHVRSGYLRLSGAELIALNVPACDG